MEPSKQPTIPLQTTPTPKTLSPSLQTESRVSPLLAAVQKLEQNRKELEELIKEEKLQL